MSSNNNAPPVVDDGFFIDDVAIVCVCLIFSFILVLHAAWLGITFARLEFLFVLE